MRKPYSSRLHDLLKIRPADILALGTILTLVIAGLALLLWQIYG